MSNYFAKLRDYGETVYLYSPENKIARTIYSRRQLLVHAKLIVMKKLYALAVISLLAIYTYVLFLSDRSPNKKQAYLPVKSHKTAQADFPDRALLFEIIKTQDPATGEVPTQRLAAARRIQLQKFAEQAQFRNQNAVPGINWTERGPDNVGGRTRALMYDHNDPTSHKVWAGGVGGGLWYTNDITAASVAWNKVSDTLSNLAISCITQGKGVSTKSKFFFGTGEGWSNIDAIRGNGIWRSLDAGVTWTQLASTRNNPDFYFVQDILYAENFGGPCFLSTAGLLAATSTGIYKSTDDGDTWTKVLGNGIAGATIDVAADLETEYYFTFATLGLINEGGGGIYRSCDAGSTWEEIYNAAADEERIEISAHYLDAWQMYAVVQDTSRRAKKIMKTSNADTIPANAVIWTDKSLPAFCNLTGATEFTNRQAWYDLILGVAPVFRNPPANDHHFTAYVGGVDLHKTINSGAGWTQVAEWFQGCGKPYVHADKHNIVFKPDVVNGGYFPDEFLVATDGGIFRTTDGGVSYMSRNKTYNITQFYSCAIHPVTTNYFLAGSQDNGTQKFASAGMNATTNIIANDHDGGFCYIDNDNPDVQITSYIGNNYFVSTDGGANFTPRFKNDSGQFINPTDYDHASNILYGGDRPGHYFRWTSPETDGIHELVSVSSFNDANITFVLLSPTVANRVYFGLDNGSVVQVDNAHTGSSQTGVVIRPDLGATTFLSCIAIDPANESHMLITYSNYGINSVYESSAGTGGSLNWTSVDNASLPDMPIRWCMFDPRNADWAILATEMGIWSTDNLNGATTDWQPTNNSFANTRVDMLRYRSSDRLLLAATHGRGLFSATVPAAALPVTLVHFKGMLMGNDALLYWETSFEQGSRAFDIERSAEGAQFYKIGSITAAGNSNSMRSYSFRDPGITQEMNYYRLRQIDIDDNFEFSRTILIRNPVIDRSVLKVLNNPFSQYIDLQFGAIEESSGEIAFMDVRGRILMKERYTLSPGTRLRIPINQNWPAGSYILQVNINNRRYAKRILKQ
jgi:hypothetical protein